jgi:hypothetical protein
MCLPCLSVCDDGQRHVSSRKGSLASSVECSLLVFCEWPPLVPRSANPPPFLDLRKASASRRMRPDGRTPA